MTRPFGPGGGVGGGSFSPLQGTSITFRPASLNAQIIKLAQLQGRFDSAQRAIFAAHRDMAIEVSQFMTEALERKIDANGRVQRASSALEEALQDPRNREANLTGFQVGIESWLDESPARLYWRNLERGTPRFRLRGFFSEQRGVRFGPGNRPIRPSARGRGEPGQIEFRQLNAGPVIMARIPAYRYMRDGGRRFNALGKDHIARAYDQEFRSIGIDFLSRFTRVTGSAF